MSEWFYDLNGSHKGPVTEAELQKLFVERAISPQTLVWTNSFGSDWKPIREAGILPEGDTPQSSTLPPPLPKRPILQPSENEDLKADEFLTSDITRSIIGEKIEYCQNSWREILKKSTGGPSKLHQVNSWNWAAFLLNIFWLAYRKMYKAAGIIAVVLIICGLMGTAGSVLSFFVVLALGFFGNSIYMQNTYHKYRELITTRDPIIARQMTFKSGGVSWLSGFAALFLFALVQGFIEFAKSDGQLFATSTSCSAQVTQDTVQSIARKNLASQMVVFYGVDADKSTTSLQYIRTQGKDGNLTNCAAHITYKLFTAGQKDESFKQAAQLLESGLEKDITYTVQPSDDNKNIYVVVKGL